MSSWMLIFANLAVIAWAVIQQWQAKELMFVYGCQSIVIGIFWFFKILMLDDFSTKGVKMNDRSIEPTLGAKVELAMFFLVHYGIFCSVHLLFVVNMFKLTIDNNLLFVAIFFFVSHGFSFIYNKKWKTPGRPNIGKIFMFPYARIIPMHLMIILGSVLSARFGGAGVLIGFMLLKTLADTIMHKVENSGFNDKK